MIRILSKLCGSSSKSLSDVVKETSTQAWLKDNGFSHDVVQEEPPISLGKYYLDFS